MATATVRTELVKKVIEEPQQVGVTLELTQDEAVFLRNLLGLGVSWSDDKTKHAFDIFNALVDAGVQWKSYRFRGVYGKRTGEMLAVEPPQ